MQYAFVRVRDPNVCMHLVQAEKSVPDLLSFNRQSCLSSFRSIGAEMEFQNQGRDCSVCKSLIISTHPTD